MSVSKLASVPVAPEVPPVIVSLSLKFPDTLVTNKQFLKLITGGVGDCSYPSPNSFVFNPITLPISSYVGLFSFP